GLLAPLGWLDRGLTRGAVQLFGWDGGLILTGTLIALVYALVVRFLTVSYNSLSGGFETITPAMDHAARSLGATPGQLVRRVHIPLLRSSVAAGAMLVFIDVMRELPATLILRPFNFDTLATRVYWLASDERLSEASTAALLIVLLGLIPVVALNAVTSRER
ncbi:MAG: iron ABC transporter permease, partial [Litorimonas sp.]